MSNRVHDRPSSPYFGWLAVGYARISSDPDDLEAGTGRQQDDNGVWVDRNGVVLVGDHAAGRDQFVDDDVSASDSARKPRLAYRRLLAAVEDDPNIRLIVAWVVDRFLRRNDELEDVVKLAKRRGGLWLVTADRVYNLLDADDVMMLRILVAVAGRESEYIRKRTKRQRQAQRDRRELPHGSIFGWRPDGQTPDPVTGPRVVEMVERLMAGESLADVARWANSEHIPLRLAGVPGVANPDTGKTPMWSGTTVKGVVLTPRHYGHYSFGREVLERDTHVGLMPGAMYEQVVALLASRSPGSRPGRRTMLTGLLYCGKCGSVLTKGTVGGGGRTWRCYSRYDLPGRCGGISMRAEPLERYVLKMVWLQVDEMDLARLVRGGKGRTRADAAALSARLDQLRVDLETNVAESRSGAIPRAFAVAEARSIEAETERVKAELGKLATNRVLRPFAGKPGSLEAAWPRLTDDVRRDVIREALSLERLRIEIVGGTGGVVDTDRIKFRKLRVRSQRAA